MTKATVAVQSALFTQDILQEVDQATCYHLDTIEDGTTTICTRCGKNLNMIKYERLNKTLGILRDMRIYFGTPRHDISQYGRGVTDYDSFKNSECQALLDQEART